MIDAVSGDGDKWANRAVSRWHGIEFLHFYNSSLWRDDISQLNKQSYHQTIH